MERSQGKSERHHRKDAKRGRPQEVSGHGPKKARYETRQAKGITRRQAKGITSGQASYSADPRIDSACTRKRAGEGHLYQKSFAERVRFPARRVRALEGRPVEAPTSKVLQIPGDIVQGVLLQILGDSNTESQHLKTILHSFNN